MVVKHKAPGQAHMVDMGPLAQYRGIPLWVLVLLMLSLVGAWSAWDLHRDYQQAMDTNYRLLEVQAKQLEARISGALRSVDLVESSIADDVQGHFAIPVADRFRWLDGYLRQLPEVRAISILDASGRLVAVNSFHKQYLGLDVTHREYYSFHRDMPRVDGIHVSDPYRNVEGKTTITVSRRIADRHGQFLGVVVAALEPQFFSHALTVADAGSAIGVVLLHRRGDVLNAYPDAAWVGSSLQDDTVYVQHLDSGLAATRHQAVSRLDARVRLNVFQNLAEVPFTVMVSRDYESALDDWQQAVLTQVGSYAVVTLVALALLLLASRKQHALIHAHRLLQDRLEEITKLRDKLGEQAIRDGLTGLFNRRYLDETLVRDLSRAKREGYALAVVMLDIDHFKRVNDTYGHAAGDEVLKAIAKLLRSGARESDVVCRYGGEEFLIALPHMSAEQAAVRVETWRSTFQTQLIRHGEFAIQVTFSAGIAAYPVHGGDTDSLVARADQALYHAKEHGRNRTTSYQDIA